MLDSTKIKRELLESLTFSMDEAALLTGLSSSHVKNACAGRGSRLKMKGIEIEDFAPDDMELYKEEKIDFVKDQRGAYPNYRIFFHGIERIIKEHQGKMKTKDSFLDFVHKEKEKMELRQRLLKEMEKKFQELSALSTTEK